MNRFVRLLIPALSLWLGASLLTWLVVQPDQELVGLRPLPPRQSDYPGLERASLDNARATLESTAIWGVQRNGQPPPPPTAKIDPEEVKIVWKVLGTALRKQDRYLLVQIDNMPPTQIKEGEELPDGSTLLKVLAKSYQIKTLEGTQETVLTTP